MKMSVDHLYGQRDRILAQLDALSIFPNTRTVRQLRRELKEKLKQVEDKIRKEEEKQEPEDEDEQDDEGAEDEDSHRSSAMKKYHRYMRLIRDNYPEYSYRDIRSMFALRKRGREVEIPDAVWQNPSP